MNDLLEEIQDILLSNGVNDWGLARQLLELFGKHQDRLEDEADALKERRKEQNAQI